MSRKSKLEGNKRLVLEAIQYWHNTRTYWPSFRDIEKITCISLGSVYTVCKALREEGQIDFQDGVARTLEIVKKDA